MLAVAPLAIVTVLFHLRRATPILHLAIDRPASSHPRSPAEKAPNPPRQKTGSVQIPIAPDAPPRHIFRGFLLWRFAYAGPPRCAPRHLQGAGIRKPSHRRPLGWMNGQDGYRLRLATEPREAGAEKLSHPRLHQRNSAEVRRAPTLQGKAFQFGDNFINDRITDYGGSRPRLERVSDRYHLQGEHV